MGYGTGQLRRSRGKMHYDNEEGLALGWMMLLLYFGAAIVIWFCWTAFVDILMVTTINPRIVAGTMSLQAVNAGNWTVNIIKFAVPLILIAGFIYAVNRAIYAKRA
jgi:hypothetical protein